MSIQLVSKQAIKVLTFTKGSTIENGGNVNHDLSITHMYIVSACDATIATRTLTLSIFTGAGGTGNELDRIMSFSTVATETKRICGGRPAPASMGGCDIYIPFDEIVIPNGYYLRLAEANYVAGDAWTARLFYRDTCVNQVT